MIENRQTALATLPGYAPFPADALIWTEYANRIVADLLTLMSGNVTRVIHPNQYIVLVKDHATQG